MRARKEVVVDPSQHDGVDEPGRGAHERRVEQRDAQAGAQEQQARSHCVPRRGTLRSPKDSMRHVGKERGRDQGDKGQRPLEKDIRQRERILLIEDGEHERERRVVADAARSARTRCSRSC